MADTKVLVVEDDPIIQSLLEEVIHSIDPALSVECDSTVDAALDRLGRGRAVFEHAGYGLIVADLFTPGMTNGYDLWDLCQKSYPETPLLITSSTSVFQFLRSIAAKQAESGMTVAVAPPYIEKPMPIARYRQVIEHLLSQHKGRPGGLTAV